MQIFRQRAYARAGLIGNPSDGYHGKTISIIVKNFWAEIILYEWPDVEIVSTQDDQSKFGSIHELVQDVKLHGYYGGIRLIKATIKRFVEFCSAEKISLHEENFSIRYETNIPRQVGLAGSSAIITATLRALMTFYEISNTQISPAVLASLVLSVENRELGIAAGLQDRVIQAYEGIVYMDFAEETMTEKHGMACGVYEPLTLPALPPLYIAYSEEVGEPTEVTHAPLRVQYDQGIEKVVQAMTTFADITVAAKEALLKNDIQKLHELIDANFDLRDSICELSPDHIAMINCARSVGASGKFAGSGGAIIGTYHGEEMYAQLQTAFAKLNCQVFKPEIF